MCMKHKRFPTRPEAGKIKLSVASKPTTRFHGIVYKTVKEASASVDVYIHKIEPNL